MPRNCICARTCVHARRVQGVAESTQRPWHAQPCFGPLAFYDVAGKVGTRALCVRACAYTCENAAISACV